MTAQWEYKVLTLKRPGALKLSETPDDADLAAALNREGMQGWELVAAVTPSQMQPVTLYLKRPR